jgi:hypothetical protein
MPQRPLIGGSTWLEARLVHVIPVENLPSVLRARFMPLTLKVRILPSRSVASRERRFAAFANTAA